MHNQKTILITGINGFVGKHLTGALRAQKHQVIGIGYGEADSDFISLIDTYFECDLTDNLQVQKLELPHIDIVIHLAGLALVGASFAQPQKYITDNALMFVNLCEKLQYNSPKPRIVVVSSGAVYDSHQTMPLTEVSKVAVNSPYNVSKLTVELVAQYYRTIGLDCIIARPMNHTGPGQLAGFLIPDLAAQVREALENNQPLIVGNLQTKRDYTDVRDVVQAYIKLATKELTHDLYNICSGKSVSGNEILALILSELAPGKKLEVTVDQGRVRPNDPKEIYGSLKRINTDTGWEPTIPIEQTIHDFLAA